ncbi:Protein-serine/threonine phosphatase [Ascochyta lentis]
MTNMMHRIRRSLDRGRGAGVSSTDTNAVQITDVGTSVIQGARPHQEDRFIALQPGSFKSNQDIALFAVFDGHAGANVAEHSRKTLADYIDATLSKTTPHSQETYKAAIQEALDQEDKDADREGWDDGSTLALVLIDTAQKILVEADIGDSHVMLAEHTRRNKKDQNKLNKLDHTLRAHHLAKGKNEWSITQLSTPHNPDNPVEKKRIEDAGGEVKYDTGTPRVGALAMSRSMGDLDLKLPRVNRLAGHNLTDLDGVETGLKPGRKASADLVINKAHFNVRNLGGESLLFLCSDGIGEARDAEVATQQATRWKSEGRPAKQIAADMASRAGKVKNSDNVTVLVVCLETSIDAQ